MRIRTAWGGELLNMEASGRSGRKLCQGLLFVLMLVITVLAAVPALASERTMFTEAVVGLNCGRITTMGFTGYLKDIASSTSCSGYTVTTGDDPGENRLLALYRLSTPYDRVTPIRGKELYFDAVADMPGPLVFELGFQTDGVFTPFLGKVTQIVDWSARLKGGHRINLMELAGWVPKDSSLALAVSLDMVNPSFRGRIYGDNVCDQQRGGGWYCDPANAGNRTPRLTVFERAWDVPGYFPTIQVAINSFQVQNGDHIFVADGVYTDAADSPPGFTGVKFNGKLVTVTSVHGAEKTVIDCQYDGSGFEFSSGENNQAVLDGFTITRASLGAINIRNSYPTIRNCIIRDGFAEGWAGGIKIDGTKPGSSPGTMRVEKCEFQNNFGLYGGAITVMGASDPSYLYISDSAFRRNAADFCGGAICFDGGATQSVLAVSRSTFHENTSYSGGAINVTGRSLISGSRFFRNMAEYGGAIIAEKAWIVNSIFAGNKSSGQGKGGAVVFNGGTEYDYGILDHCTIIGNESKYGGGLYLNSGRATVGNSILWNNKQTTPGLGKEISALDSDQFVHIYSSNVEGGLSAIGATVADAENVIDADPRIAFPEMPHLLPGSPCIDSGVVTLPNKPTGYIASTEDLEAIDRRLTRCSANGVPDMGAYEYHGDCNFPIPIISNDMVFLNALAGEQSSAGYLLSIRNGSSAPLKWRVTTDSKWLLVEQPTEGDIFNEISRISLLTDSSELPAGEYRATLSVQASYDNTQGPYPYSQDNPKSISVILRVNRNILVSQSDLTIQDAIDGAAEGDVVLVSRGSYPGQLKLRGKRIVLRSKDGRNMTGIDCGNLEVSGLIVPQGNRFGSALEGFTIKNCKGTPNYDDSAHFGGGIWVQDRSMINVTDCAFMDNFLIPGTINGSRYSKGGGMSVEGTAFVSNCEFRNNDADWGGGIYVGSLGTAVVQSTLFTKNTAHIGGGAYINSTLGSTIDHCQFIDNSTVTGRINEYGGGAFIGGSDIRVNNSEFRENIASLGGGGVNITGQGNIISNSLFVSNSARDGGGATMVLDNEIRNSTFRGNIATGGKGGGINIQHFLSKVTNCIVAFNSSTGVGDDVYPIGYPTVTNSAVYSNPAEWLGITGNDDRGIKVADPLFVSETDLRLGQNSPCIDAGRTINSLYSDIRGSYRAIDGKNSGISQFDMGAYEYSRFYGEGGEDQIAKAFQDLTINGSVAAVGFEYRIQWRDKDPFPQGDERVRQPGTYKVRILLVSDSGRRIELGTWNQRLGQNYTVPYTFGYEHIGTWRIRLELAEDSNQYLESAPVTIQYRPLQRYFLGKQIPAPPGAAPGVKPDVSYEPAVYWSAETGKLFAVAPDPVTLTWYLDQNRTIPYVVVAGLETPNDPQTYVNNAVPAELVPEGSRFDTVNILWMDNEASVSGNRLTSTKEGWTVLLFKDPQATDPGQREAILVVHTLDWDHAGKGACTDLVDPTYPCQETVDVGQEITNQPYHEESCGGGYVFFELAPYDGSGDGRAYDRTTRNGPIFAVNEDMPTTADDLVVVWYRRDAATGVCWPSRPVRYDPQTPFDAGWEGGQIDCPGDQIPDNCNHIIISEKLGSGALSSAIYGTQDQMRIYSQPDRSLPGFNPNEEHAAFFSAGEHPGVFPLRADLNVTNPGTTFTSKPFVLVKYRDPDNAGKWNFRVFKVSVGELRYKETAGNEFNRPYPLSQFVLGPCNDDPATEERDGSYATFHATLPGPLVHTDKDKRVFAVRKSGADEYTSNYYYYRLLPDFWFDRDRDDIPDKPTGTCVPWLEGHNKSFDGTPVEVRYGIDWPNCVPSLYAGETLTAPKMQEGETVGLPNIMDQCRVDVLFDETVDPTVEISTGVRLFDPLIKHEADLDPTIFKSLGLNTSPKNDALDGASKVLFRDLPPQLQSRLTYDAVGKKLRLMGRFITDTGEPTLLLNTLSIREREQVFKLSDNQTFRDAVQSLKDQGDPGLLGNDYLRFAEMKALSAGAVGRTGYVTLAFNDERDRTIACPAPTMLQVIKVACPLYEGEVKVIESPNAFDEKLTMRHNGDFGGEPDNKYFQWMYLDTNDYSGLPKGPGNPLESAFWREFTKENSEPGPTPAAVNYPEEIEIDGRKAYRGLVDITPKGTGAQLLPDRWFVARYYYPGVCGGADAAGCPDDRERCTDTQRCGGHWSDWTKPQLYEGWVKRVVKKINLFDQKVKDFHLTDVDTVANMIAQAGPAYEGDVALSDDPAYLKRLGLIELYETLLGRALRLCVNTADPSSVGFEAVLFATSRLNALYQLLGNEAFADAADPTIGYSTKDGQYGSQASSIFCFQNQADSLLEEELALLRGTDRPVELQVRPFYNRLAWNFTIADGEVAYRQTYNIQDFADREGNMVPDGEINEFDAKAMFPQGHGDAWGHYLMALKKYYYLITHPVFEWNVNTGTESILVAQAPLLVDYRDERAFAAAAAARARAGAQIVGLTYRLLYKEDPELQWRGYPDQNPERGWGLREWGPRAGFGAYLDWAVGNALLPDIAIDRPHLTSRSIPANLSLEFRLPAAYWTHYRDRVLSVSGPGLVDQGGIDVKTTVPKSDGIDYTVGFDSTAQEMLVTFKPSAIYAPNDKFYFTITLSSEGIEKIDRTTVTELYEIAAQHDDIQAVLDQADAGLNPLGVAKDTVPFDIDPSLVSSGETHFEQVYGRALKMLNNAVTVFDYASQSAQNLRRQQDSLEDFRRTIEDREADLINRLTEIFGTPYPEDCGPGKLYETAYCDNGPDLYHYMYIDQSENPSGVTIDSYQFEVLLKDLWPDDKGVIQTKKEIPVSYNVATDSRFGVIKPYEWKSHRKAPGELQIARSDLMQLRGRFEKALTEYKNLLDQIMAASNSIEQQHDLNEKEVDIITKVKQEAMTLGQKVYGVQKQAQQYLSKAKKVYNIANAVIEAFPKVMGAGLAVITDPFSPLRSTYLISAEAAFSLLDEAVNSNFLSNLGITQAKETAEKEAGLEVTSAQQDYAVKQQLAQLKTMIGSEAVMRQEIGVLVEGMQQSSHRYLATIARGERLLAERLRFRVQTAAQIQEYRYRDMTFRVFRNDALQKYRAQFDLAARYVYLAAKAYDYETTLLDADTQSGGNFLGDVVKQRSLGSFVSGQPLAGIGLANTIRQLEQNFEVLKPQLGFSNPQMETNRFSLRRELLRVGFDASSDKTWRDALSRFRVENLWDLPEYERFCRPFGPEGVAEPGLVIPFRTTVTSGLNFFGWPLGGGDSYYSASNFSTKVRSAGVWLSDYNGSGLAQTPRVYLVPAGEDILRSPTGSAGEIRSWQVMDQKIPEPFPIVVSEMAASPNWIPSVDTIHDRMFQIRRHSDFKAYHDSGYLDKAEMTYDTRLIGRSVWNTNWLLIIPGRNLLYDPDEGLDMFINGPEVIGGTGERTGYGVSDIKLFFETYSYSGN